MNPINRSISNRLFFLILVVLLVPMAGIAAESPLTGAWQIVEATGHDSKNGDWKTKKIQPGLFLFVDGHYSMIYVTGDKARALLPAATDRDNITEEQLRATFKPIIANSGTYTIKGSSLTTKPMVALWPNFMESGSDAYTFSIEKDMLTLTEKVDGGTSTFKLQRVR